MPERKHDGLEARTKQIILEASQAQAAGNIQTARTLYDQAGTLGELIFDLLPNKDRRRNHFGRLAMEGYYRAGEINKAVFVAQRMKLKDGQRDLDLIAIENMLREIQRPHSLTSKP